MDTDLPDPNRGFSLKRFLNNPEHHVPVISKRRKAIVSLSKSRRDTPSQSSQQSQLLGIKIENLQVKTEKLENIELNVATADIKLNNEKRDVTRTVDQRNETSSSLVKDETIIHVKQEQLEQRIGDILMKEEIKHKMNDTKEKFVTKNEPIDFYLLGEDNFTPLLEEYICPICNQDLTRIKSSYMRQNHVESCISQQPSSPKEELEFDCCVFCGKDLSRLELNQRQYHLNNCLDDMQQIEEKEAASIAKEKDEVFAGQRVPFLSTLDLCPVCHEFTPFTNRTLKQKMKHIKQCAKQNRLSLNQLLKKFQWIGWGHLPVAAHSTPVLSDDSLLPSASKPFCIPDHQLVAYVQDLCDGDDGDFTDNVIIHKTRTIHQSTAKEDKNDEELQTALALSRSVNLPQMKRKQRLRPSDERDWNAANIWSVEESRIKAIAKLDELLFPGNQDECKTRKDENLLRPSRFYIPSENDHFYWNLASNKDCNWDNPRTFMSLFIQELCKN